LKTIEDTKSPPKQTSIKRSPPSESKPSKRQKTQVTETVDTEQYEIADVFPKMDYTRATQSKSRKPDGGEIETKQDESKTDKLNSEKRKEKLSEAEGKKKMLDAKTIKSEKVKSTKMGKESPEPLKRKESIPKVDKKEYSKKKENLKQDVYEFEDDDVPVTKTNHQTNLVKDIVENRKIKNNHREEAPIVEEIKDEMDLNELVGQNKEILESNNDIWSSINETLKDLKESTNNKQITKPSKVEKSSLIKEKFQPMEDCKDSLLDDLNSSQSSELDGWPYNGDILKDEIT
jgi:signal peptidase I